MACELEDAFDEVRALLPDEWFILEMSQDGQGWYVRCGKMVNPLLTPNVYVPYSETRAGTLTKALTRMADALREYGKAKST